MKNTLIPDDNFLNEIFNKKKTLPTLQCASCGNCEFKYDDNLVMDEKVGFCLRFFENTSLEGKNVSCWTSIKNEYYRKSAKMQDALVNKKHYVNLKNAEKHKLNLNQTTLF